jgi:uncharacterized protein
MLSMLSCLALSSCGRGAIGEALRPEERTATEAMGEAEPAFDCTAVAPASEPLVVDWPDQQRMDLALAVQEGVAVVHYGCDGLHLVKHCSIDGSYRFAGAGIMKRVLSLDTKDAVQATLPVQGIEFSAGVGGESKIDVATAIIGRRATLVSGPTKSDLRGECDAATHYVRSAYIGAFSMGQGTAGQARVAAEVFQAGASADSSSTKSVLATDGDLSACEAYESGDPPPKCQSIVRLEIYPISPVAAATAGTDAPAPEAKNDAPLTNVCMDGFVSSEGRCVRKEQAPTYRCDPTDLAECEDQCGRGNGDSCYNAAQLLHKSGIHAPGTTVPPGQDYESMLAKAAPLYEMACNADVGAACNQLAGLYSSGQGGMPKDPKKAEEIYMKACGQLMHGLACSNFAGAIAFGKVGKKDPKRVADLYGRACDLGNAGGCGSLGRMFVEGTNGARRDADRGMSALVVACNEAKMPSLCYMVSEYYQKGKFVTKDLDRAAAYKDKACAYGLKSDMCAR